MILAWLSRFNPHGASKHHFSFIKTNLFLYTCVLRGFQNDFFREGVLTIYGNLFFYNLLPSSGNHHTLQVGKCDRKSGLVVDGRLQWVIQAWKGWNN